MTRRLRRLNSVSESKRFNLHIRVTRTRSYQRFPHYSLRQSGFLADSWAAVVLIIVNIGIFFYFRYQGGLPLDWVLFPHHLLDGHLAPLVTSGFLHADFVHLAMNMLGIFIFGRITERHLGTLKTFFIYFGSLAISMFCSTVIYVFFMHKDVAVIGASGAVMGLMAAAVLLDPFCVTYEMILPLPVMIKGWMFLYADIRGFLGGETDGVSHLAHLCGFLSIGLLVYFLSARDKSTMRAGLWINIYSFFIFFLFYLWIRPGL